MNHRHSLLRRQLRAHWGEKSVPADIEPLLEAVSAAYRQSDDDRVLVERALDLSSQELLQANAEFRAVLQAFPDVFLWLDAEGKVLGCRATGTDDLWLPSEEIIGRDIRRMPIPDVGRQFEDALQRIAGGEPLVTIEYALPLPAGPEQYECRLVPLDEGRVLAIIRNITSRKWIEQELGQSLGMLQATLDSTEAGILVVDNDRRVLTVNQPYAAAFGVTAEWMIAASAEQRVELALQVIKDPEKILQRSATTYRLPETEDRFAIEFRDGRAYDVSTRPFRVGTRIAGRLWTLQDVTERTRAEVALRDSERRYRLLFQSNPHPMWVYDLESFAFLAVNDAAVHHYGYTRDEFLGMTILDIRPADDVPRLRERLARLNPGMSASGTWRHRKKDGSIITVEISSYQLEFDGRPASLVLANDVTARLQLEDQLRQSQKMEAIGQLAGGVAHDFNNLLTAIMGYTQLLLRRPTGGEFPRTEIEQIEKAAQRAGGLTRQLLAFSRQQVLQPKVLHLNSILGDMDRLLRRLIGDDIELQTAPHSELWRIKADPSQLEQLIVNLAVNARDAMPRGGKLMFETANVVIDAVYANTRADLQLGRYVALAVSDTGCGMDAETRSHMFEPFFTTKEIGKGTGLGLSTVHGIVKQSGGHIEVYSEVGRGSTFKIYLPAVDELPDLRPEASAEPVRLEGRERILLVDDEEALRLMLGRVLRANGYDVVVAADGDQALSESAAPDGHFDVVVTDVVMPGMSGPDLVTQLQERLPGIIPIYMSGYTDLAVIHQGVRTSEMHFVQKPFEIDAILLKLREVIQERTKAA